MLLSFVGRINRNYNRRRKYSQYLNRSTTPPVSRNKRRRHSKKIQAINVIQCERDGQSLRAGRSGDGNPVGGEIFRSRPDSPWDQPSLVYNGYRVSFPGGKRPGRGVDHPPASSAEVKERVDLYFYSPSGPSWPVIGWTVSLPLTSFNKPAMCFRQ